MSHYTPNDVVKKLLRLDDEIEMYCDKLDKMCEELANIETEYDSNLSMELVRMLALGEAKTTAEKIAKGKPHIIALSLKAKGQKEQVKNLRQRIDKWTSRLTVGQSILKSMDQRINYNNYTV